MLKLKDDTVNVSGLRGVMFFALGIADVAFAYGGHDCVITAALDGDHNPGSKHPLGLAVDIRNVDLDAVMHDMVFHKLQRLEIYGFDVIDEKPGQTGKTTASHFHIEYDPKPGELTSLFG
jgi:hypothetical protein